MRGEMEILDSFFGAVCLRAEKVMEITGKVEGAHYAAMRAVLEERRAKLADEKPPVTNRLQVEIAALAEKLARSVDTHGGTMSILTVIEELRRLSTV